MEAKNRDPTDASVKEGAQRSVYSMLQRRRETNRSKYGQNLTRFILDAYIDDSN
jgi:hypothetical protein